MVIKNTSPTTPKPTPTPAKTEGPTKTSTTADVNGTSDVDGTEDIDGMSLVDGATNIEELEGMSLADGMAAPSPATVPTASTTKRSMPTRDPEATAKLSNPSEVAKLINSAAEGLAPGESVVLGGKLSAGEAIVAEAAASVTITKRADGRLDVKVSEAAAAGLGIKAQVGASDAKAGGKGKAMVGAATEATYVVNTGNEAAILAAKFAAKVASAATPVGQAVRQAFDVTTQEPHERKFALTGEVEIEGTLLAGLTLKGADAGALVESPPGTWFVEVEVEGGGNGKLGFEKGLKVKGDVKATVRVPVTVPSAGDLQDPLAFAHRALAKATDATMEIEVKAKVGRPGVGGEVKAKKEFPLGKNEEAVSSDGWKVTADVLIGPREESASIAVAEVEVTATRSFHVLTRESGSLKDLEKAKQAVEDANLARGGALRTGAR